MQELPDYVRFTPGVPVKPMLAKATTGISEVLDKFSNQEFTCEYKYDGERAQVHFLKDGGKVFIYRCATLPAALSPTCSCFLKGHTPVYVLRAGRKVSSKGLYKQQMCHCSRNSENNTGKYPDIAGSIPGLVKEGIDSVVLDCEAVAFERDTGKILPFQV